MSIGIAYTMNPTPEEALAALAPWIQQQQRKAWTPIVSSADNKPADSKFSGLPVLLAGEKWPRCKSCRDPLELFVQLNLATLPSELGEQFGNSGILQLFYCVSMEYCEGGWEPFSDAASLCRVLPEGEAKPAGKSLNHFPAKAIIGWEPTTDLPDAREHESLGVEVNYHFNSVPFQPAELMCPELNLHFIGMEIVDAVEESVAAQMGDKLAGWPHWIQGVEYPSCPECGTTMQLVMQLDSEKNVPYMFGDSGIGHITQCPNHKHVVAFGWACC